MNAPHIPLFRKEVLEQGGDRLYGYVHIAVPVSWQLVGYVLATGLAAIFIFLALASYARVETASGTIVLDSGVAPVVPTRPGLLMAIRVRENQRVKVGAPLAGIRAEETLATGGTAPARILEAMAQQDADLAKQSAETAAAAAAEQSRLAAQMAGLAQEIESIEEQLHVQRELVGSAAKEVALIQDTARRGYISRRDVLAREETLMTRRQHLAQLQQLRIGKSASLAEAQRSMAQSGAEARAQAAGLSISRSELAQRRVDTQAGRGYMLLAPIAGTVTAVTARVGQAVSTQQPLMIIVPDDATILAELYVPTRAAGFLRRGQEVRLAVDAFAYQRFGTIAARISTISATTVAKSDDRGATTPVYLVTAALDQRSLLAFGRQEKLLPGMTFSARIVTEKRSLFEWLFEPIYAVRGR